MTLFKVNTTGLNTTMGLVTARGILETRNTSQVNEKADCAQAYGAYFE